MGSTMSRSFFFTVPLPASLEFLHSNSTSAIIVIRPSGSTSQLNSCFQINFSSIQKGWPKAFRIIQILWMCLFLSQVLSFTGCTSKMSSPLEVNRIGIDAMSKGDDPEKPLPWGKHVIAANEMGAFNHNIYKREFFSAEDAYTCERSSKEEKKLTKYSPEDRKFEDCLINVILDHLKKQIAAYPHLEKDPNPESLFDPSCAKNSKQFTLMLFIHGGLNSTDGTLDRARYDTQKIINDCIFPIFLNWEAGFFTSYVDQILNVREGKRIDTPEIDNQLETDEKYRILERGKKLQFPLYIFSDLAEALARAPTVWVSQGLNLLGQNGELIGLPTSPHLSLRSCESTYLSKLDEKDCKNEPVPWSKINSKNNVYIEGEAKLKTNFAGAIIPTVLAPLKILTTPFVDSIGETTWNNLKRTNFASFALDKDYLEERNYYRLGEPNNNIVERHDPVCSSNNEKPGHEPSGIFAKFAHELQTVLCEDSTSFSRIKTHEQIKLNLVAHSMGSILANELVDAFDLDYDNIVYLASASSIRHFHTTVTPYIQRRIAQAATKQNISDEEATPSIRFYNLMLHPKREAREATVYGAAPAGSLLVWIDSMFEESDSLFDRTLGQWDNVRQAKWLIPKGPQQQMFFKVFGETERVPDSHGAFTDLFCASDMKTNYAYWNELSWGHSELWKGSVPPQPSKVCKNK
jgi:hypothetical protein